MGVPDLLLEKRSQLLAISAGQGACNVRVLGCVVRSDPLQDTGVLSEVESVMTGGRGLRQDGVTQPDGQPSNPSQRMLDRAGGI